MSDPDNLESAIRQAASQVEAYEDGTNDYDTFFRVERGLAGPNGRVLQVALIWLQWNLDGTFHFVTLKPQKVKS